MHGGVVKVEVTTAQAAEDSWDNESDAVGDNWWTKSNKKTPKHEAETRWNNSNKATA